MKFQVVTLFPEMIEHGLKFGVVGSALQKNLFQVEYLNPRDFAKDSYKTVDDKPFGGGDGMVMEPGVWSEAIETFKKKDPTSFVVSFSPQGEPLSENLIQNLMKHNTFLLVSSRYAGIDQRITNQYIDKEISLGDFVLSGGEVAVLAFVEALTRKIPGVLGDQDSAAKDSFVTGLLEAPQFTRPQEWMGQKVPAVLLSGHHQKIQEWQEMMAWLVTYEKRQDLFWKALAKKKVEPQFAKWVRKLKAFDESLSQEERKSCGLGEKTLTGVEL